MHQLKKQLIISSFLSYLGRQISVCFKIIVQLILLWPSPRLYLLEISKTKPLPPPKRFNISLYTPRIHISCNPKMARPLIKRLKKRKRKNSIIKIQSKIKKVLFSSSVLKYLVSPIRLVSVIKIFSRSLAIITKRRGII